jgi:hypothetical protein
VADQHEAKGHGPVGRRRIHRMGAESPPALPPHLA